MGCAIGYRLMQNLQAGDTAIYIGGLEPNAVGRDHRRL